MLYSIMCENLNRTAIVKCVIIIVLEATKGACNGLYFSCENLDVNRNKINSIIGGIPISIPIKNETEAFNKI